MHQKTLPPEVDFEVDLLFPETSLPDLHHLVQHHGDCFRVATRHQSVPTYVLSHPDFAQHVFATHHKHYGRGAAADKMAILLGKGILVSDGEVWRQERKVLQPMFHDAVLAGFLHLMERSNHRLIRHWQSMCSRRQPVDLVQEMNRLTMQFNLSALFGEDMPKVLEQGGEAFFDRITEGSMGSLESNLIFIRDFRAMSRLFDRIIEQRKQQEDVGRDFLGMLIQNRYRSTGKTLPNQQIIDEIMVLLTAGHETVATALKWIWLSLARQPDIAAKIRSEMAPLADLNRLEFAHLKSLTYTRQVIQEALRLYPSIWVITRKTQSEDEIGGYYTAPGTHILIAPYIIHRHPGFWEDPEKFDPERFAPGWKKRYPKYAYLPFSHGPRRCLGDGLSIWQILYHLTRVLPRFDLTYLSGHTDAVHPGFVLRTKQPCLMQVNSTVAVTS